MNAHDIAIEAHEDAIEAIRDALRRRSQTATIDAAVQSTTAAEQTAMAEGDATDRPSGEHAAFAVGETEGAHDCILDWAMGPWRFCLREAIQHHEKAIAAHAPFADERRP